MHRFLYGAVQHLYRCNLFPEREPGMFLFLFNASATARFLCIIQAAEHEAAVDDSIYLVFIYHAENVIDTSGVRCEEAQFCLHVNVWTDS